MVLIFISLSMLSYNVCCSRSVGCQTSYEYFNFQDDDNNIMMTTSLLTGMTVGVLKLRFPCAHISDSLSTGTGPLQVIRIVCVCSINKNLADLYVLYRTAVKGHFVSVERKAERNRLLCFTVIHFD